MAESVFATLECELLDRSTFHTQAEAECAIFEFIEGWYNLHHCHSSLGYLLPSSFERQHAQNKGGVWISNVELFTEAGQFPEEEGFLNFTKKICKWLRVNSITVKKVS